MGLDINNKSTQQYVDEYGLILSNNADGSKGDCIGTTADAYRAYGYHGLIDGIKKCYACTDDSCNKLQAHRHPSHIGIKPNTMSRDHVAYTLLIMKYAGEKEFLKTLSKKLTWKISDRFNFTIDLWLYMKAISGCWISRLFFRQLYWIVMFLHIPFLVLYRKSVFSYCKIQPELTQKEWEFERERLKPLPLTKFKWLLVKNLRSLPMYTIYQMAFMWDVLPDSPIKFIMKRILRIGVDKQNYVVRMMLGDKKYSKEEIYSYKPMTGGRFTTYLNALTDRHVEVITDPKLIEANVVEVDLVRKIYEELNSKK